MKKTDPDNFFEPAPSQEEDSEWDCFLSGIPPAGRALIENGCAKMKIPDKNSPVWDVLRQAVTALSPEEPADNVIPSSAFAEEESETSSALAPLLDEIRKTARANDLNDVRITIQALNDTIKTLSRQVQGTAPPGEIPPAPENRDSKWHRLKILLFAPIRLRCAMQRLAQEIHEHRSALAAADFAPDKPKWLPAWLRPASVALGLTIGLSLGLTGYAFTQAENYARQQSQARIDRIEAVTMDNTQALRVLAQHKVALTVTTENGRLFFNVTNVGDIEGTSPIARGQAIIIRTRD